MSTANLPSIYCTITTCPRSDSFLNYDPTFPGNAAYLAIFAALLLAQIGLGVFYKTWGFLLGVFAGLVLEVIGYAGRLILRKNPFLIGNFLLYFIPLGLGPACLCASIYVTLGRIVVVYSPSPSSTTTTTTTTSTPPSLTQTHRISFFRPRTYALVFCTLDIIALSIQGVGGGLTATAATASSRNASTHILLAGLVIQAVSLCLFLCCAADVFRRVRSAGPDATRNDHPALVALRASARWRGFLVAVGAAAILIFIRTVYRVVELSGGFGGSLAQAEVPFMVLEGPMVMVAVLLLTIYHPGVVYRGGAWEASRFAVFHRESRESVDAAGMGARDDEEAGAACCGLGKRESDATTVSGQGETEKAMETRSMDMYAVASNAEKDVAGQEHVGTARE